jgi:hypothetical protein
MLKITIRMRGKEYHLPDPENEIRLPILKDIQKQLIIKFQPVFSVYPNAKIVAIWDDAEQVPVTYVSTNVSIQDIQKVLDGHSGTPFRNN